MTLQINTQVIVTGAIVGAATIFGYYNYKKYVQNKIPTRWEPIGHVAELYIYPLKSGRRLGIKSAKVTEYGLQSEEPELCNFRDRMWNNEKVPTIDCGDEVAEWISTYLLGNSNGLRLGYHDGKHKGIY
ncbi:hypothetical protein FQA39_LY19093 [Lamprigera yunnana]|nr:hypothetical protein FQA39_LY19093 [Lamprigera yunnana]